jgi:hypothetical protein
MSHDLSGNVPDHDVSDQDVSDQDVSEHDIPGRVRRACAWVADQAGFVHVEESAIDTCASGLPGASDQEYLDPASWLLEGECERRAAFVICLDAINFGSGWWPTIRKRPGLSGHRTIATALTDRFRSDGGWSSRELTEMSARDIAEALGQDPEHPLMDDFASCLRDVGAHVRDEHGGRFADVIDAAGGSAVSLVDILAGWKAFADTSTYGDRSVPFFKRAQIAAADVNRTGVASFRDEHRLTAFADNLVPHVLRLDGVLRLEPALAESIDVGELLIHGSVEEVELRACAIHAVELLSRSVDGRLWPAQIDGILWNRGQEPRYKATPRPRSRNTAY